MVSGSRSASTALPILRRIFWFVDPIWLAVAVARTWTDPGNGRYVPRWITNRVIHQAFR